jgi:hypothetical protein
MTRRFLRRDRTIDGLPGVPARHKQPLISAGLQKGLQQMA